MPETFTIDDFTPEELALAKGEEYVPEDSTEEATDEVVSETEEQAEEQEEQASDSQDSSEETTEDSWINDDMKDMAASYGLSDEELADFGSAEEFERFGKFLDRQVSRREAAASNKTSTEDTSTEETTDATETTEEAKSGKLPFDIEKLEEEEYSDITLEMAKTINALTEQLGGVTPEIQKIVDQQNASRQEATRKVQDEFDSFLDETADNAIFGKRGDGKVNDVQMGAREEVWGVMAQLQQDAEERAEKAGRKAPEPNIKTLATRAIQILHPENTRKIDAEKVEKQSKTRRPVTTTTATRKTEVRKDDDNDPESIANDPALLDYWNNAQRENGVLT